MNSGTLRALEFDRIVAVVAGLAVTPSGRARLDDLSPSIDQGEVATAQRATTEGVRFLADHPGFPLRAPSDLDSVVEDLSIEGRALEPLRLMALAGYLESIEHARSAVLKLDAPFPILRTMVATAASFGSEIADVRRKVTPSGDVADDASPSLASLRERLRRQRGRLRATLDALVRGRDTAKYLQEPVVTDRNGRYVVLVRAEHRSAIPGVVHGASASGASLFLEPMATVEINNEIVALEEAEAEEVRRILLALTDAFRARTTELHQTLDVGTGLDCVQARARFSLMVGGVEPVISESGLELRGARHPLLIRSVAERARREGEEDAARGGGVGATAPVPIDILLTPPVRVLVIAGPNTGGKTVALKTAGLFAAMAQAGLHLPADQGSRLPVYRSLFADIGDEQSISASLSTFSAHITNIVSMNRRLELPALVLLDEVGAGTDPVEGGALGIAVIDHFRCRGAHLIATTHYDSLKSYASTTEGVEGAAFGFDPGTFAPTYRLTYGSPGRSLAIEIAARLGVPESVIASARQHLTDPERQLAEHLARVDENLRTIEGERRQLASERSTVAERERRVREREAAASEREDRIRRRLETKLNDQLREARRQIDDVIEGMKARAAELGTQAAVRLNAGGRLRPAGLSTGEVGAMRTEARAALDGLAASLTGDRAAPVQPEDYPAEPVAIVPGARVTVGTLGLEGTVLEVHGTSAEVDVRGKRLRAALRDLTGLAAPAATPAVRVRVDLQPREGSSSELNVIGATVDEATGRLEKFLDEATVGDARSVRIVHGHGTGQLRRAVAAFLKTHPLVERFESAPDNQGGAGATVVYLKD